MAEDLPGPGTVFLSVEWKFVKAVYVGDSITGRIEIIAVRDVKPICTLATSVRSQDGMVCLSGTATTYTVALERESRIWELEPIAVLNSRMFTKPGILLRIEGGCVLALSILCYREIHTSWILFVALFLVPDLAILGYLGGIRIGTIFYNLVHTLIGPLLLIAYAVLEKSLWLLPYGLVWTSHIGIDRLLGFGLKYPTRFNDTHLQHI